MKNDGVDCTPRSRASAVRSCTTLSFTPESKQRVERVDIEIGELHLQFAGEVLEVAIRERAAILAALPQEQQVVVVPEPSLVERALGR